MVKFFGAIGKFIVGFLKFFRSITFISILFLMAVFILTIFFKENVVSAIDFFKNLLQIS